MQIIVGNRRMYNRRNVQQDASINQTMVLDYGFDDVNYESVETEKPQYHLDANRFEQTTMDALDDVPKHVWMTQSNISKIERVYEPNRNGILANMLRWEESILRNKVLTKNHCKTVIDH